VTRLLQSDVIIGRHAVDAENAMAFPEQPPGKMKTDEPRRSSDEKAHWVIRVQGEFATVMRVSDNHLDAIALQAGLS
jgi:hypothetical protein